MLMHTFIVVERNGQDVEVFVSGEVELGIKLAEYSVDDFKQLGPKSVDLTKSERVEAEDALVEELRKYEATRQALRSVSAEVSA